LWIKEEFSFDGHNFNSAFMKYATGSTYFGVPEHILNNALHRIKLTRGPNMNMNGPFSTNRRFFSTNVNSYEDFYIKINGLITKTTALQSKHWSLGFPVYSRYENIVNIKYEGPLQMTVTWKRRIISHMMGSILYFSLIIKKLLCMRELC
jgi:hypothetical protein